MKQLKIKLTLFSGIAFLAFSGTGCKEQTTMKTNETELNAIFPKGEAGPAGQILIITDGEGFHQIKGQPRESIKKGDVVKCPPNVMHWHGASPEIGMQQMYIISNTEKGIVKWLEPVTDEEYNNQ